MVITLRYVSPSFTRIVYFQIENRDLAVAFVGAVMANETANNVPVEIISDENGVIILNISRA